MPVKDDRPCLIDSQHELDALIPALTSAGHIGCDTEFVRTQTYWPHLCLVQVSTGDTTACIDVLADLDSTAFRRTVLGHPEALIFHAVKQDLEAWYAAWNELPAAVFDIQVAAGLLGFQPQIGYANLVRELLDIELDKDQTRTDWSRRPLTARQIRYATDDVAYLHDLNDILRERLLAEGRLEWALEDCRALLDVRLYDTPPEEAWQRISGIPYLPVETQARARALTEWREQRAKQSDRPRRWIMADKPMMQIAKNNPATQDELRRVPDLPAALIRNQGKNILQTIRRANEAFGKGDLALEQKTVPVAPDRKAVKHLTGIVRDTAGELGIAPELLATRRDIADILNNVADVRALDGWRRPVIGEKLLAAS